MPRAFSETEQIQIRERLLTAGKELLNKVGLRHLVIEELVARVGISKGSFYAFFPSREDFILSVFESWEAEYRGALLGELTTGAGTTRERLEAFFLGAFRILESEPGLANLRPRDIEALAARLPPERLLAHQANDNRVLEETFALWAREGRIAADLGKSMEALVPALFAIALHKDDFRPGGFEAATRLIAEALAMRLAPPTDDRGGSQ
jgi:AcrR family transcriptional regulator